MRPLCVRSLTRAAATLPPAQALASYREAAALNPASRELGDKVRLLQKLVSRRQQQEQRGGAAGAEAGAAQRAPGGRSDFTF